MSGSQNSLFGKRKYGIALILLLGISVISVAFRMGDGDGFGSSRREVLLRRIGHETLLQSGDSTSRVLPIKKIAENEYQIRFEKDFSFLPDSLVNTTRRVLANNPLASDYVVNILNCADESVAYGYAVANDKKDDIVACLGRKQPKGCYTINIKFNPTGVSGANKGYLLGGLLCLALVGVFSLRSAKPRIALPENLQDTNMTTLGSVLFDAENGQLVVNGAAIDLTGTETRVMRIFAQSPNQTIERSRLQKEIWEDEGVIVGRSLDMFISKLRKKLEPDPTIKIAVVRGKGYRLEISS